MEDRRKVLLLFLDGVGLGVDDPEVNPFSLSAMPNLQRLLGGHKLVIDGTHGAVAPMMVNTEQASLLAIEACMGIEGTPQSASGQAALLTGKNVPAWLGEHEGPKPTGPIVDLIGHGSVFTQLKQHAKVPLFINAYPPRYFDSIDRGYRLPGVIALAAMQAGLHLHTKEDLYAGKAISADFTGEGWRSHLGFPDAPVLDHQQVGERLNALAEQSDLTIFEYWLTDVAGHHQDLQSARQILEELDAVIGSLVRTSAGDGHLVLLTSDHGNLEDLRTRHHTRNDVPLLLIGSQIARDRFLDGLNPGQGCRLQPDLTDICPAMVRFIG